MAQYDSSLNEVPVLLGKDRSLVGVVTLPKEATRSGYGDAYGVLLLNAGLIHRIGPNRIYVRLARMLANMGFVALRFDYSGVGDSGPRRDKLPGSDAAIDETKQAMTYLEEHYGLKHFICIGLCAGAAAASQVAVADERVHKAVLVNPMLPWTRQTLLMYYSRYYYKAALFNPRSWLKFLFMQSSYRDIWHVVAFRIRRMLMPERRSINELPEIIAAMREFCHRVGARKVQLFIGYSDADIGEKYLQAIVGHEYRSLKRAGLLQTATLCGADHLVTPLASQQQLATLISRWLSPGNPMANGLKEDGCGG